MIQLWAWEYEGKTEFGGRHWEGPFNSLYVASDSFIMTIRDISEVTNLRKVKVVDEDCQDESHTFVNDTCKYCGQKLPFTKTYLTTEPKNFGAIVEAETINHKPRMKWVHRGNGTWYSEDGWSAKWSDLINTIIKSEGVER